MNFVSIYSQELENQAINNNNNNNHNINNNNLQCGSSGFSSLNAMSTAQLLNEYSPDTNHVSSHLLF